MARTPLAMLMLSGSFAIWSGCSQPSDTVEVSGIVTWNGAPLAEGIISFFPLKHGVRPTGGGVQTGAYKFRSTLGKMRVELEATRPTGQKDSYGRPLSELFIPERYNRNSELTVDVTRDGQNRFEFALTEHP